MPFTDREIKELITGEISRYPAKHGAFKGEVELSERPMILEDGKEASGPLYTATEKPIKKFRKSSGSAAGPQGPAITAFIPVIEK